MIRPPSRSRRDAFSSSILLVDVVAVSSRKHLPGHRSFSLTLSPSLPLQSSPLRHFSCIAGDRDRSLSLSLLRHHVNRRVRFSRVLRQSSTFPHGRGTRLGMERMQPSVQLKGEIFLESCPSPPIRLLVRSLCIVLAQ